MISWETGNFAKETIIENKSIASYAYLLRFRRKFEFIAGQVIGLGINQNIEPRLYSIASGEHDEYVDIIYTEKPDGLLTPMLSLLKAGDPILVTKPFGSFTEEHDSPIFIATGTGIAPFVSMLKSKKCIDATLIHGVRSPEYFYFSSFLKDTLGSNYIQCCSGCQQSTYYSGRVTHFIERQSLDPNKKYYLCGVAEMVVEVRDLLISKGIPFSNIIAEIYF